MYVCIIEKLYLANEDGVQSSHTLEELRESTLLIILIKNVQDFNDI